MASSIRSRTSGSKAPKITHVILKASGREFSVAKEVLVKRTELLENEPSVLKRGEYTVQTEAPVAVFATFVKMLEGGPMTVRQDTCEDLEALSDEFGFADLADECAAFRTGAVNQALLPRTGKGGPTTIVMIGPTGAGKSSLGNRFLGSEAFQTSSLGKSETSQTTPREAPIRLASASGEDVTWIHRVIDTPGLGDTEGRDWEFFEETIKELRDKMKEVNLIAFVFPLGSRVGTDFHKTLKMLLVAFEKAGASLWDHTCLVVTKCFHDRERDWYTNPVGKAAGLCQDFKRNIQEIAQECTENPLWRFDIPVFLVDSAMEVVEQCSEQQFMGHPAVGDWLRNTLKQNVSPFRGWQDLGPNVPPLVRARFNFMLLEEWARSRPAVSTVDLQIPVKEYFKQRIVKEEETRTAEFPSHGEELVDEEYTEKVPIVVPMRGEDEYIVEIPVKEVRPHLVERTVMKTEKREMTRKVERTRMKPVKRMEEYEVEVERPQLGFSAWMRRWASAGFYVPTEKVKEKRTREVTDYLEEKYETEEPYLEEVQVPVIEKEEEQREVTTIKFEKRKRTTETQRIEYKDEKKTRKVTRIVPGVTFRVEKITRTGRATRGWEPKAQWTEPVWEPEHKDLLDEHFRPTPRK
jgi:hypothetical protein